MMVDWDALPRPSDDGACRHLPGTELPQLSLPSTDGGSVELSRLHGWTVLYAYPRTAPPGEPELVANWDAIPGARGCTEEACSFRDHQKELAALGARVLGLSTQRTDEQRELIERAQLNFPLLSDAELALTRALRLPTFAAGGRTLLKRHTLIARGHRIDHVFYPVFPPHRHGEEVRDWLARRCGHEPRELD